MAMTSPPTTGKELPRDRQHKTTTIHNGEGVLEVAILASNHISWHNHFLRHVTELSIVSSIAITIYHLLCQVLPLSTISTAVSD
ncbi:hypothetical protein BRADI_1g13796v3 [Brachypodium distachyon]|uniref:Uncharacterized protein n=1 Tax=Brachypodium distachyon TaxID=15368 RepID=A0A2K2DJD9_BRADI|nr:hypothetical protein BRADI_1g13796v3 [Brachypodium distachyon]